jgi:uncharacterized membrane protein YoaT (DUF817 family)
MSWMEKEEEKLLQKAFFFGIGGIIACLLPLFNRYLYFMENNYIHMLTGIGIGAQFFALSIAVLVIRKRKITHESKARAQRMAIALTVSLIFFFII